MHYNYVALFGVPQELHANQQICAYKLIHLTTHDYGRYHTLIWFSSHIRSSLSPWTWLITTGFICLRNVGNIHSYTACPNNALPHLDTMHVSVSAWCDRTTFHVESLLYSNYKLLLFFRNKHVIIYFTRFNRRTMLCPRLEPEPNPSCCRYKILNQVSINTIQREIFTGCKFSRFSWTDLLLRK